MRDIPPVTAGIASSDALKYIRASEIPSQTCKRLERHSEDDKATTYLHFLNPARPLLVNIPPRANPYAYVNT